MNIVGIIAEYNPMHNGHIYHIKKAKELSNADYCIVIMSGSFTEQGNVATLDKFTRAKLAIENGADLVIELPTIYSTASAEIFAKGAVDILNSLGCITHIAFGAETNDLDALKHIATTCVEKQDEILLKTKEYFKSGITAASARDHALKDILDDYLYNMISLPNNILGIEYLKALLALNSQIKPILINRQAASHQEQKINNTAIYASSTAIREVLMDNTLSLEESLNKIKNVVPKNTLNALKSSNYITNESFWNILKYEILKLGIIGLKNISDVNEGLENKLYKSASCSSTYSEYIFNVKSKRYTLSRIKRICAYILLGITKDCKNSLENVAYCRILKVKNTSLNLLSLISNTSSIPVISKLTDKTLTNYPDKISKSLYLDILSNNIVGNVSEDYTNNIIV